MFEFEQLSKIFCVGFHFGLNWEYRILYVVLFDMINPYPELSETFNISVLNQFKDSLFLLLSPLFSFLLPPGYTQKERLLNTGLSGRYTTHLPGTPKHSY